MTGKTAVLAAISLGILAAAGQEPVHWPWFSLFVVAGGFWLIGQAEGARSAFWRGWAFGAGYFATTLHWIVEPFLVDIARYGWMAPFAVVLLAGGLALFWGGGAYLAYWITGPTAPPLRRAIALAVSMTGMEMLRSVIFTGFPWGMIGTMWVDTPVAQVAAFGGAHALNLLTYLAAAGLAAWVAGRYRNIGALLLGVVPIGIAFAGGLLLLNGDRASETGERPLVRLIQPNAAQHLKWKREMIPVFWQRKLALTAATPSGDRGPDLVIWPEVTLPYFLGSNPEADREVVQAASGAPVIVGAQRNGTDGLYNALAVLQPDGRIGPVYDKHHLVPFGEYFPGGALAERFGLRGLATLGPGGFSAGSGPRVLDLSAFGLGRVLPLICYEAIFPRHARVPGERPDWIVQITNDAWFGDFAGPQQHLAQAQLRSIETGLPMLRVANTGISAVIDATGQVRASLALSEEGFLDVTLPTARPATIYTRTGNWPVLFVLMIAVLRQLHIRRAPLQR